MNTHKWNEHECSCGSDTVICQGCGRPVCGAITVRIQTHPGVDGNVGPECLHKFGKGHAGPQACTKCGGDTETRPELTAVGLVWCPVCDMTQLKEAK